MSRQARRRLVGDRGCPWPAHELGDVCGIPHPEFGPRDHQHQARQQDRRERGRHHDFPSPLDDQQGPPGRARRLQREGQSRRDSRANVMAIEPLDDRGVRREEKQIGLSGTQVGPHRRIQHHERDRRRSDDIGKRKPPNPDSRRDGKRDEGQSQPDGARDPRLEHHDWQREKRHRWRVWTEDLEHLRARQLLDISHEPRVVVDLRPELAVHQQRGRSVIGDESVGHPAGRDTDRVGGEDGQRHHPDDSRARHTRGSWPDRLSASQCTWR